MKKINILFTIWSFEYGGAERFVLNLIKALDKTKYNPIVFSDKNQKGPLENEFKKAGAKVIYSKYHRFKHPMKYIKQLRNVIREEKIDIIHANDDLNMYFALKAKPKTVRFIAHSHTTNFKFTNNATISKLLSGHVSKYIAENSDLRLSCGEEAGKAIFGKKDFEIINNGIFLDDYYYSEETRKRLRVELGIPADYVVWLNIGRIDANKNHVFLAEVFNNYRAMNKKTKLLIIGNGCAESELKDYIAKNNLSDSVIILSSRANAYEYYNVADIFVMPSLYEGIPVTSVEAQANGLRCVFSDSISSEADHVKDGSVKFISLEDGAKAWATMISRMQTGHTEYNYDRIKKYDIKNVAKTVEDIYTMLGGQEQK